MMFQISETLLSGDNKENCFEAAYSAVDFAGHSITGKYYTHCDVPFLRDTQPSTHHINPSITTEDVPANTHFPGKSLYLNHGLNDNAPHKITHGDVHVNKTGDDLPTELLGAPCAVPDNNTCLRTPCKRRRTNRSEWEQTSGYDSSNVSCEEQDVRESMEISRYLNESSGSTGAFDDVTTEEAEISQLEALMRTPDMKTADRFLTTLAEFSPSNFFQRSPLNSICSPRVDLLHDSFSSSANDSNSCGSSVSSHRLLVPPRSSVQQPHPHTTSTPFSLKRHPYVVIDSSRQQGQISSSSFACHNEDTVVFTPSLADRVRNKCFSQSAQSAQPACTSACSTPKRSDKSRRLHFNKPTCAVTQKKEAGAAKVVPKTDASFVIPTKLDGMGPTIRESNKQTGQSMCDVKNKKSRVGRGNVKVKQHAANTAGGSHSRKRHKTPPPILTVRPFQTHFFKQAEKKDSVEVEVQSQKIQSSVGGTKSVKKKGRKRLSPIRLPDAAPLDGGRAFLRAKTGPPVSPFHRLQIEQSRSNLDSKLQKAAAIAAKRSSLQLPRPVCYEDILYGRSLTQIQFMCQAKLFLHNQDKHSK